MCPAPLHEWLEMDPYRYYPQRDLEQAAQASRHGFSGHRPLAVRPWLRGSDHEADEASQQDDIRRPYGGSWNMEPACRNGLCAGDTSHSSGGRRGRRILETAWRCAGPWGIVHGASSLLEA